MNLEVNTKQHKDGVWEATATISGLFYSSLGSTKAEAIKGLMTVKPAKKLCPSCNENYLDPDEVMNSLSRRDNETYICNDCGMKEALEDYLNATQADQK